MHSCSGIKYKATTIYQPNRHGNFHIVVVDALNRNMGFLSLA